LEIARSYSHTSFHPNDCKYYVIPINPHSFITFYCVIVPQIVPQTLINIKKAPKVKNSEALYSLWRVRVGIEPTHRAVKATQTVLKTANMTFV